MLYTAWSLHPMLACHRVISSVRAVPHLAEQEQSLSGTAAGGVYSMRSACKVNGGESPGCFIQSFKLQARQAQQAQLGINWSYQLSPTRLVLC